MRCSWLRTVAFLLLITPGATAAPADASERLACLEPVTGVTWMPWESARERLEEWCSSVGPPVFVPLPSAPGGIDRLLILSWNVHVGGAQIEQLLPRLLADRPDRTGIVLLLQETYRSGEAVPDSYPRSLDVPSAIRPRRPALDVVALAGTFGLSVAYVPSMRNGKATSLREREDRGNAVLSTEPLSDVRAIELPFGKQRRVAVAATVTPRHAGSGPLRVIAAHLDTNGARAMQARALEKRIGQMGLLPVIVGGDLNARGGLQDAAVQAVSRSVPLERCGNGRTHRWPLRLDVLVPFWGRLDFIFSSLDPRQVTRTCETLEQSYESDHLPVLLTLQYEAPKRAVLD